MLPAILAAGAAVAFGSYLFLTNDKPVPRKPTEPVLPDHPLAQAGAQLTVPGQSTTLNGTTFTVVLPPPGPPVVTGGPLITQGLTQGGIPIYGLHNLNELGPDFATSAMRLSDYLHANGIDGSPALRALVMSFQQNARKKNVGYADAMLQPGVYDLPTSAALAVAIGQPVAPDTQGKAFASFPFSVTTNPNGSNAASASATNLWSYFRAHGNDHSPQLQVFARQFQHDVNTDPRFPGPAALGTAKQVQKIRNKIKEDGGWGTETANALRVYGMAL